MISPSLTSKMVPIACRSNGILHLSNIPAMLYVHALEECLSQFQHVLAHTIDTTISMEFHSIYAFTAMWPARAEIDLSTDHQICDGCVQI